MPIKSFKGQIANEGLERISLSTNNGLTGYRIVKMKAMPQNGSTDLEAVLKVYTVKQNSATTDIDFSDNTLLAAAIVIQDDSHENWSEPVVIFDNMTFNQDIYVTNKCHDKSGPVNYYIELEAMQLDLLEQSVATLQSIRSSAQGTGQKG